MRTNSSRLQSGSGAFSRLTESLIQELRSICGSEHVITEDVKLLDRYGRDQVADARYAARPEAVVRPGGTGEIQQIMRLATRERIPVTPRGAGSGLSGGAVPVHGGISLSFERMNRIIEIDTRNLVAVVEPGVVTDQLDSVLAESGLFFAGYPLSEEFCFVGGNVAENAGGGRAVKYGVTSRYLTGLEVVTASGERMEIGGKRFKDVTGLDLLHLLAGSEGTLALFTKISLRLLPRPAARAVVRVSSTDESKLLGLVPGLLADRLVQPSAIEYLDSVCLTETRRFLRELTEHETNDEALLFVEIDGSDAVDFPRRISAVSSLVTAASDGVAVEVADTDEEIAALWRVRKQVPWALKKMNPRLTAEDIVVPVGRSPELLKEIRRLSVKHGVRVPFFGHAGDGNYHASPMKPGEIDDEAWDRTLKALLTELYERTAGLGGTISGEHGIGHKRLAYLPIVLDETHRALLARIKGAFDPSGILNPGKLYG